MAQFRIRVGLQFSRHPRRRRRLFAVWHQTPTLDGVGSYGPQFGVCRVRLVDAQAVQEADKVKNMKP